MKKILILAGIFIIMVIFGYLFADWAGIIQRDNSDKARSSQVNYLLIRVDDLAKPKPNLQSIWGMFISFANRPSVFFQPIYPHPNTRANLGTLFAVADKGTLAEPFLKEIEKFDLKLAGYIVLDDKGAQLIQKWAEGVQKTTLPTPTKPSPGSMSQQRANLNQICQGLSISAFSRLSPLDWKPIYPDHLIPSPKIEDIITLFDRLFFRSNQVKCEVLD